MSVMSESTRKKCANFDKMEAWMMSGRSLTKLVGCKPSSEMINPDSVEEADVELCASGFDNLLMEQGQVELRSYHEMLVEMGALKCAAIVKELLDWIDEAPDQYAIDVVERDKSLYNNLWRRYDAASCEEKPQELARSRQ